MKFLRVIAVVGVVGAGCAKVTSGDVLRVTLTTAEPRVDTCYEVEVRDEGGAKLDATRFLREEGKTTYLVGVARGGTLPQTVLVNARALVGVDCGTATRINGVSDQVSATFDPKAIVDVAVSLEGGDADRDGFVATSSGGLDCNDADETVSPAADEQCSGTIDRDCDGKPSCSDEACTGLPCAGIATKLVFVTAPASVRTSACSGPLDVQVRDAMDRATSPSNAGPLTLSGPVTFFAGPSCAGAPLTSTSLEAQSGFSFIATTVGTVTLGASAPGLAAASANVEVLPSPPVGLELGTAVRTAAGTCSPQLVLSLVDDAGALTLADAPVLVALSSDAGQPFSFYADLACQQAISALVVFDGGQSTFHFFGQRAGAFQVRADGFALGIAEAPGLIDPGPIASVQLATPDGGVLVSSSCVGPFTVTAYDSFDNATVPTQLTADAGEGVPLFSSTSCVNPGASTGFAAIFPDEGVFTVSASSGGFSASQNVLVRHAGPAGSTWRWPLTVTTNVRAPVGGYDGYTLLAAFDSRDDVDAGRIDTTGSNLRLFFRTDGGWQEIDRLVEGLNTNATRIRFRSQSALADNATDLRYSLFSGSFDGGVPLERASGVYLFADDFAGCSLGRWSQRVTGLWQVAVDAGRTGGCALLYPSQGNSDFYIEASPALSESDVMLEAWWKTSSASGIDFSQAVRMQPGAFTLYETNLEGTAGWNVATMTTGTWDEVSPNRSAPTANAWTKIGLSISGRDVRVWRDGVQITPQTGVYQVPSPGLDGGNVGFRKHNVGGSMWIDDVTARRYTEPEPGVVVGAPYLTP